MTKSYGFLFLEYDEEFEEQKMRENGSWNGFADFSRNVELYYSRILKKWVHRKEYIEGGGKLHYFPASFRCNSLKSAKRHLKKHNEIPKGTRFRLVSKYIGGDTYLFKK